MKNTLLFVTFGPGDRKWTLERILKYYDQFSDEELPYIVITDQSKETWTEPSHRVIKAWHHFPTHKYNMYEMWIELCRLYPHEYVCWNNDDDFTTPSGVKMANEFLDNNPDYSLATGQVVQFKDDESAITEYGFSEWQKEDRNDNDVYSRLKNIFNNVHVNPHAFFRKETWRAACELVLASHGEGNNFGPVKFWDKVITYVAAVDGYRKTNLNCVSSVRTNRASTNEIVKIAKDYHNILEKDTPYIKIYDRLKVGGNRIERYLYEKYPDAEKVGVDFLLNIFDSKNIDFGEIDHSFKFPSLTSTGREEIERVRGILA